jgi:hypothetical protein
MKMDEYELGKEIANIKNEIENIKNAIRTNNKEFLERIQKLEMVMKNEGD